MAAIAAPAPAQDPHFDQMLKFVTTGNGARNVSRGTIQKLIEETKAKEGGEAYLNYVLSTEVGAGSGDHHGDQCGWEREDTIYGSITLTKVFAKFDITGVTTGVHFDLTGTGFFVAWSGPILSGKLFYHTPEDIAPGPVTFEFQQFEQSRHGNTIYLRMYRDGRYAAGIEIYDSKAFIGYVPHSGNGTVA